jgi:hypothetical protein
MKVKISFKISDNWSVEDLRKMASGGIVTTAEHKKYAMCQECKTVVCINKKIFGDFHICTNHCMEE